MLTFKSKKETDAEHAHVEVYSNGKYIGYYIKNSSKAAQVNENWNFCSVNANIIPHFPARTKKQIIQTLESHLEVSK